ncbi:MAG: hypothetical protein KBC43_05240, partial [Bacteroidales bacterium]|nr:hypothetical protein [Bacteroidales bacterium]
LDIDDLRYFRAGSFGTVYSLPRYGGGSGWGLAGLAAGCLRIADWHLLYLNFAGRKAGKRRKVRGESLIITRFAIANFDCRSMDHGQ